jgi:hypothetical protein
MTHERSILTYPDLTSPRWTVIRVATIYVALIMLLLINFAG